MSETTAPVRPGRASCLIRGCETPQKARGWCRLHYQRWLRNGDPLLMKPRPLGDVNKFATTGISYRQLDYWTARGYLESLVANPGSGFQRTWSDGEREIATRIKALVDLGMTLATAARVARHEKAQAVLSVLAEVISA